MGVVVWTLADVIVKLRKQKRWGRLKLSTQAKVSYATITRLETGREMKEASIRKVATAFGLSLAQLYALVPQTPTEDVQTRERDRLWVSWDLDMREKALAALQGLAVLVPAPTQGDSRRIESRTPATPQKATGTGTGKKRA